MARGITFVTLPILAGLFNAPLISAQSAGNPTFEVASVRLAAPRQLGVLRSGGPGTPDPGQITWNGATMKALLTTAYDVKQYQLIGPSWLDSERYDITAKVDPGATRDQVNVMFQNLLAERFGVVVHRESKEFPVSDLVAAKGGIKLKETTVDPTAIRPALNPREPVRTDKTGFLILPDPAS